MANNVYVQRTHRWVADDGSESGSTLLGSNGDDRSINVGTSNRIRIRFVIEETADSKNETNYYTLWLNHSQGGSGWEQADTSTTAVQLISSTQSVTDGTVTTERLGYTSGGPTWTAGAYCDDNDAAHGVALKYTYTEVEFCIYVDGSVVANNDTINLRVYNGTSALDTYDDEPVITVIESTTDNLTGSDVTNGTTTVDAGTLGQTHILTATEITSGTPTLDTGTVQEVTPLTASEITSGTPTVDAGTLYADVTYGIDEANWFFSPTNWYKSGTSYAITNSPAAYMKLAFTGTGISMTIDLTLFEATTPSAADFPRFKWRTDGGSWQTQITTTGQTTFTFETGLSNTSHTIEIYFESVARNRDRWLNPSASIRVDDVTIEDGGGLTAPSLASERWLVFGDSRVEGVNTYGDSYSNADQGGARTWAIQIGELQGAEVGAIGWVSQGWGNLPPAISNVPRFNDTGTAENSWTEIFDGVSRSFTGIDTILVNIGVNDGLIDQTVTHNNIVDFLTDIRTAAPSARIILLVPFMAPAYEDIPLHQMWSEAFQDYFAGSSDTNVFITSITGLNTTLDYDLSWQTPTTYSEDGGHPNQAGHDEIASLLDGVLDNDILMANDITSGTPTVDAGTLGQTHALTGSDITSGTPTVDAGTLTEVGATYAEVSWIEFQLPAAAGVHPLTGSDVTSGVPTVDSGTLGQTHVLTATEIDSGTPTVDAGTLGQEHTLTATEITSAVPTVDSGTLGQAHALNAVEIDSGIPTVDSGTLGQTHVLTATDITSGQPTVDAGTLGQTHVLSATEITSGQPTVDAGTAGQSHVLTATEITSGQPTVDTGTIGQTHVLTAADVTSGQPTVDAGTLTHIHVLTASDITSGIPTLDTPTVQEGAHSLTATEITSGTPTVDSGTLGQTHVLTATEITSSVPTLDTPTVSESTDSLTASDVTSGTPTLDAGTIGQEHALTSSEITSSVPTLDTGTLGQTHVLSSTEITSSIPTVDLATIGQEHVLTGTEIASGIPTLDASTIGQVHVLTGSDVSSTPTVDIGTLEIPRFLRPDTDVSVGSWQSTEATLHDAVNETVVNNNTYIYSDPDPTASDVELGFEDATDPESSSFHIVHYVSHKDGTGTANVTYYLMQGAVQIATWTDNDISETPTMREYELSSAEADSITNYNDLRIIAEATVT